MAEFSNKKSFQKVIQDFETIGAGILASQTLFTISKGYVHNSLFANWYSV